jgi:hypothetical protein
MSELEEHAKKQEDYSMASQPIYEFYAELADFEPMIWRRFQVPGNITLARLGYIVMTLFEMKASHLFSVEWLSECDGETKTHRYEVISDDTDYEFDTEKPQDATAIKLCRITGKPGARFNINYDFGDNWWVVMKLEKVFENKELPGEELPRALDGAGFGIVEDCGGTYGLEELTEAFRKKKGERYKELSEWLGLDNFDVTAFDLGDMNFRLKKTPRIYKQCYEDRLYPTERSVALIERDYLKKRASK